jgi:hypothetical protein
MEFGLNKLSLQQKIHNKKLTFNIHFSIPNEKNYVN